MIADRRKILKSGLAAASIWLIAGLLKPIRALAAEWSKSAFEAHKVDDALQNYFGSNQHTPSNAIKITAPYQAENGATVRFAVTTTLPEVSAIAILVEKNERPLASAMRVENAEPYISLRLKMAKTSDVYAIVQSQGKLYSAKQNIKITVGGCGG